MRKSGLRRFPPTVPAAHHKPPPCTRTFLSLSPQLWRLITNFLFFGKFGLGSIFLIVLLSVTRNTSAAAACDTCEARHTALDSFPPTTSHPPPHAPPCLTYPKSG